MGWVNGDGAGAVTGAVTGGVTEAGAGDMDEDEDGADNGTA